MTYQISIYGKVQGVGFRYFVLHQAQLYGVKGFVRNLPDGSVFCEAEAEKSMLDQFVAVCTQGPARAAVNEIIVNEVPDSDYTEFRIR